jgi:hypothetical protein
MLERCRLHVSVSRGNLGNKKLHESIFIHRSENILQIHNEEGYNLLQKCVGLNNLDMIR